MRQDHGRNPKDYDKIKAFFTAAKARSDAGPINEKGALLSRGPCSGAEQPKGRSTLHKPFNAPTTGPHDA